MTNGEKLRKVFPYLNIVGTVFMDKRTEQVLAASVNFNWLDAEYQEPITKNDSADKCIDRWDINGKEAEAWMVNGRLQIRNRGTIHNIDLPSITPQEPFKPMVEIDLYSVIKQKYIEREVLDKIRAEIDKIYEREGNSVDCLNALDELKWFIDKYKGESEDNSNDV